MKRYLEAEIVGNKVKIILQLPVYLVKMIRAYERMGYLERNNFIENSLANHGEAVAPNSLFNDVGCEYPENTIPLLVSLPKPFAFQLGLEYQRLHISLSDIAAEVLPHSVANLIAEIQAQEDYRLEVELENERL